MTHHRLRIIAVREVVRDRRHQLAVIRPFIADETAALLEAVNKYTRTTKPPPVRRSVVFPPDPCAPIFVASCAFCSPPRPTMATPPMTGGGVSSGAVNGQST
uniref:Uncharacterized protein n=1 Tax=Romanomermis culicivorax TaxID=13658 RepID=A0A915I093_ROMCU